MGSTHARETGFIPMAFGKFERLSKAAGTQHDDSSASAPKTPILIIDDDDKIRDMLAINLRRYYEVRLCANGDEGIQAVNEKVHSVILDIKMPGKDGLQVYKEIKAKFPELPIIFYSAFQDLLEGARLRKEYRPFDYLHKDSNIKELYHCLEKAVRYYKITRNIDTISVEN